MLCSFRRMRNHGSWPSLEQARCHMVRVSRLEKIAYFLRIASVQIRLPLKYVAECFTLPYDDAIVHHSFSTSAKSWHIT